MHLSPREIDRLLLFQAAELARRRRARGLRLTYPEARALIADELCEAARDGATVAETMALGTTVLTADDVLPGVPELVGTLQVEAFFEDGQKLVTVHDPISPTASEPTMTPGEVVTPAGEIELSPGRSTDTLTVVNDGDRPIQVGSHYHFFEVNRMLRFDRRRAFGMHLDIPAGTAVRFEPGEDRQVSLVAFGGTREIYGLNTLTDGEASPARAEEAVNRAKSRGFALQEDL